jgi:hypothetical protein
VRAENETTTADPLTCAECGRVATDHATGWKAFRTDLEDEPPALAFYCAGCAEREFGDR